MHPETAAIHAGTHIDPSTGAVITPIVLSTTFARNEQNELISEFVYSRAGNPNRKALEERLAAMEQADVAITFSSGLAAAMAILHSLSPGDHIIISPDMYFGVRVQLELLYKRWGLQVSEVDTTDMTAIAAAIRPHTRLIWTETPSNPLVKITDLRAVAALAHRIGAVCVCDNTWSPLIQKPLDLGVDLVMYSTTKYIGGHSDLLGGAVISRQHNEMVERIRTFQHIGGAVPSPFECWLMLRSIATLPQRMEAHSRNAMRLASFLAQHPAIEKVHYAGLPTHPQHGLAAGQMAAFGGMLSVEPKGGKAAALKILSKLKLFARATSLGGVESLIEHRATVEAGHAHFSDALLRISVGLEHPDDLIADFQLALEELEAA
ncbi:MAG: PLP-dependent aspartate aminotransferase family protein [Cytophagales bacterium]|nr:PLP-dependent aspartate aminotransferase family protein [Bernardetiaceae bacterium]MDW8203527.1 PLP-dependent aspartate aminotransferase family protein [Cytophagales bacterium]